MWRNIGTSVDLDLTLGGEFGWEIPTVAGSNKSRRHLLIFDFIEVTKHGSSSDVDTRKVMDMDVVCNKLWCAIRYGSGVVR